MARRAIGIEIGRTEIRVVQLVRTRRTLRLESASSEHIGSSGATDDDIRAAVVHAIRSAVKKGGIRTSIPVSVTMPPGAVMFQQLETDLAKMTHVREVLRFEMEDGFPLPADDLVMDICGSRTLPDDMRAFLIAAVRRTQLHEQIALLRAAGLECGSVDLRISALLATVLLARPEFANGPLILLHADPPDVILGIALEGSLVSSRRLEPYKLACVEGAAADSHAETAVSLVREIHLTWRDAFGARPCDSTPFVLSCTDLASGIARKIENDTSFELVTVDPFKSLKCANGSTPDARFTVALGLSVRTLGDRTQAVDLLVADSCKSKRTAETKKLAALLGLLLGCLAAAWMYHLFVTVSGLEGRYQETRAETKRLFLSIFPEEQNIVDETAQLEDKLKALRKEHQVLSSVMAGKMSPVRILQYISDKVPPEIKIVDLSILGQSVRLIGTADSFNSIDVLKNRLQSVPVFNSVVVRKVDKIRVANGVSFELLITVTSGR